MNILYISKLPKTKSSGLRYSVPQQIYYQSKYDQVYWINLNEHIVKESPIICNYISYPFDLDDLPEPFNKPDLVVFQDFYYMEYIHISKELINRKIPYTIVPRGALTKTAQKIKRIKKIVGNIFYFKQFARNALAIQYLTKNEFKTSTLKWNKNYYIIPNGVNQINISNNVYTNDDELIGVFIGRFNKTHKGLDLLINSIINLKDLFIEHKCKIKMYGPDRNNTKNYLRKKIQKHKLEEIVEIYDEVYEEEKKRVLRGANFFVLTSRFEGHPMGLIEALSYGIPCFVTTGTNMDKEIKKYNAGWTAKTNIESICKNFRILFKEKMTLSQKGRNAKELSNKYNWINIAKNTHNYYKDILNINT